ncbi:MAG: leucine-rich repeat domain-containing protein [Oscillospiraceae bacterium]|nr:leucine-rich repeat domain-containing protein [Oscillospiraceae bacterium]
MLIKKITVLAASAALVFSTLCFSANAATPEEDFIISGDGYITGYNGNGGDVIIPDGITGIGESAFMQNDNITNLVIPDGCTKIGMSAFSYCSELKTVTFEGDMEEIGMMSFLGCPNLEIVTFKGNIAALDEYDLNSGLSSNAFMGCRNLKTVEFVENSRVDIIKRAAFMDCENLTDVKLPKDVGTICEFVFTNCPELTKLEIPSMTELEDFSVGYMFDENTEESVKADGKASVQASLAFDYDDQTSHIEAVVQKPITLIVDENSPAEKYAKENGIAYEYKTTAEVESPAEENPQTGGNDLLPICFLAVLSLSLIFFANKKIA